jgi:hypothetical protein
VRINPHLIAFFLAKLLICFAIRGLFRRHNLLVVGSNPTGPTSILNAICHSSAPKGGLLFISERRVRRVCGCGPRGLENPVDQPLEEILGRPRNGCLCHPGGIYIKKTALLATAGSTAALATPFERWALEFSSAGRYPLH